MMRRLVTVLLFLPLGAVLGADLQPISSAELCGDCHRAIHEAWKESAHSEAMESRLFQDSLQRVKSDFGEQARRSCLGCHAPLAVESGDFALKQKTSWEGVTCDYCHSVRSVATDLPNPKATLELSLVKSGPLEESVSGAHNTMYSPVHTSSAICAPCHQYRNPLGLDVLTTYREWEQSRYAKENVQCQTCHMGQTEGDVVDPRVERSTGAKINLHAMPGSHSLTQLTKAVRVRLTTVRKDGLMEGSIEVANVGAGHYMPTGSPARKLVLEVDAVGHNGSEFRQKWIYRRTVADENGNPLGREPMLFFKAAQVVSDTRLAPDEKRVETFSFAVPSDVSAQINAKLIYYYSPMANADSQERITIRSISRFVK
jgi:cytochrome c554/c'-like protein